MFEKNKIKQTYTNKPTITILCPTCNIGMLQCQHYGGVYWICNKCGCRVERTED